MSEVPWSTVEPGLVEKVVAVLLSRENPAAQRVRPSQGDGGLDVVVPVGPGGLVDDYQVKAFASRLTAVQKAQVRKSLSAALATHQDPDSGYTIRAWYLTLPLDATREQKKWLAHLADGLGVPFACDWRGLAFVDGLAAKYPAVIDYHLRDGKERLEQAISDLRAVAGFDRDTRDGRLLEPADAEPALRRLSATLNRDDPHFRYELEVTAEPPEPRDRHLLLASVTRCEQGTCVTWHVLGRFADTHEYRDVPMEVSLDTRALDAAARQALHRFHKYGQPVRLEGRPAGRMTVDLPGGLGHTGPIQTITLGPARTGERPVRVRWTVVGAPGDDAPRAELLLSLDPPSTGPAGGQRTVGRDTTGVVTVEVLAPPDDDGPVHIRIDVPPIPSLKGLPVQQALPALRFLATWHAPHRFTAAPEYGPQGRDAVGLQGDPRIHPEALAFVEALDTISRHSGRPVLMPDLTDLNRATVQSVLLVAAALHGERVPVEFNGATLLLPEADLPGLLGSPALSHRIRYPLTVTIDGTEHPLPEAMLHVPGGLLEPDADAVPDQRGLVPVTLKPDPQDTIATLSLPEQGENSDQP